MIKSLQIISEFNVGKRKKSPEFSQDSVKSNLDMGLFSISDGVAQSFFSQVWSTLLTEHFCYHLKANYNLFHTKNWQTWLEPAQNEWRKRVDKIVMQEDIAIEIKNKHVVGEPAAATFVGLKIKADNSWQAMVIGDSVLFHLSYDRLIASYLLTDDAEFGPKTEALASYPIGSHSPKFLSGTWTIGDNFILATDGIAKWLLGQEKRGEVTFKQAINTIRVQRTYSSFLEFVRKQQRDHTNLLEDDDVAILFISSYAEEQDADHDDHDIWKPETPFIVGERPVPQSKNSLKHSLKNSALDEIFSNSSRSTENDFPQEELDYGYSVPPKSNHPKIKLFTTKFWCISALAVIATLSFFLYATSKKNIPSNPIVSSITITNIPSTARVATASQTPDPLVIFSNPDTNYVPLFVFNENYVLSKLDSRGVNNEPLIWLETHLQGWVYIQDDDGFMFDTENGMLLIQGNKELFVEPTTNSHIIGTVMTGAIGKVIQIDETLENWVQVDLSGYIPIQVLERVD